MLGGPAGGPGTAALYGGTHGLSMIPGTHSIGGYNQVMGTYAVVL